MAGRRQHILPQFLLNGFKSRQEGKKSLTWVFRVGKSAFESNIASIGFEKDFYGKAGEPVNADPGITEIELDFSRVLGLLRQLPNGTEISHTKIAEFVTHLSGRTKHLRDSLIETSDEIVRRAAEVYSNEKAL